MCTAARGQPRSGRGDLPTDVRLGKTCGGIWQVPRASIMITQTGVAMVTMLDRHALPSQSSQVMMTSRPAPVWAKISSALRATSLLRQHIDGLHAVAQGGVRSFDLDGVAAAQIPDVVENAAAFVAYGVSDQYRRSSRFARRSAVAPPAGDAGVSWGVEYPILVALDGHDWGVHTDSRDPQRIRAVDALQLDSQSARGAPRSLRRRWSRGPGCRHR